MGIDVPADDVIGILVAGRDNRALQRGGEIFATDNTCTQRAKRGLCEGFLEGHEIGMPGAPGQVRRSHRAAQLRSRD